MKKLLIVIDTLYGGGAERVACRIANALSVDNEVVIYTRSTPDTYQLQKTSRYCILLTLHGFLPIMEEGQDSYSHY